MAAKSKTPTHPNDLKELFEKVIETAETFGYKEGENAILRDCISSKSKSEKIIRKADDTDANYWFGFIREDEPSGGAYNGLSFVIFPEREATTVPTDIAEEDSFSDEFECLPDDRYAAEKNKRCLVAIGIGSSSIGKDGDLASNPGFRRSFMRLTKEDSAKYFFKVRFDEMETSTPGLQEELCSGTPAYDDVIIGTTTKYNADSDKEAPGLLPAAFIVNYTTEEGWTVIKAWLAQYAKWRCWDRYQKGTTRTKPEKAIKEAIAACRSDLVCPTPEDIYKSLIKQSYIVLQGAPGCGKTWSANAISETYFNGENDQVIFTQFHAETSYSDFVYGIRPSLNNESLAYRGEKGILIQAIEAAETAKQKQGKVLLIIDEINRANLANVLGPVFYLFEPNVSRCHELILGEVYDKETKKEVQITCKQLPDNLYVMATMNTADKSLAVVDFALRRRFAWITLRPHKIDDESFDSELFDKIDELFSSYATDEELNLQPGQSYFKDKSKRYENIIYGLMPLMKEYFAEGFLLCAKEEFAQLFYRETKVFMFE